MITTGACPRCGGSVLDYKSGIDSPVCIACGWRKETICADVLKEIQTHLGEDSLGSGPPRVIAKGKPPLSGWQRAKRRKERENVA